MFRIKVLSKDVFLFLSFFFCLKLASHSVQEYSLTSECAYFSWFLKLTLAEQVLSHLPHFSDCSTLVWWTFMILFGLFCMKSCLTVITLEWSFSFMLKFHMLGFEVWVTEFAVTIWANAFQVFLMPFLRS